MTTVIVPGSGQGALLTQQGPGTTPGYSALDIRRLTTASLQEGVYGTPTTVTAGGVSGVAAADFMVTQRAAGANLSVDINMPGGGMAFVQGDTIAGQGLYAVPVHSANINEALASADFTNPRIDQIILEVQDNVLDATGGNLARTRVLTGSPNGSATLNSRAGAATLPGNALLLADVLVAANATSVANSAIRDRRKWARGGLSALASTSGNQSTTSTSFVTIGSPLFMECSGSPLRIALSAVASNTGAADGVQTGLFVDGSAVGGALGEGGRAVASAPFGVGYEYVLTPAPGFHSFQATMQATIGGTATVLENAAEPLVFAVQEIVRQNASNRGVTTG